MHTILIRNATTGGTILLSLGPAINIAYIPIIDKSPCDVFIPKSACLNTSTASSTVTPTTLLALPSNLLNIVTTATQNTITR